MDFLNSQMWAISLLTSICFVFIFGKKAHSNPNRLPPGPTPLPIFGNLLQLAGNNKPHKCLTKLASIYGPIMTLKLGSLTTIIISSPLLAKEIFRKHDLTLSTPFVPSAVRAHQHDQFSVAWLSTSSTKWRTIRKIFKAQLFSNQSLDAMQRLLLQEVGKLMDDIRKNAQRGVAIDINKAMLTTSFNFMLASIFSMDSSHSSSREIMDLVCSMIKEIGAPNLGDYFPFLDEIDLQGIRYRLTILCRKLFKIFDEIIDARLKERKGQYINSPTLHTSHDMLDTLLDMTEAEKNDQISRPDMLHLLLDLFGAGIDTTSVTLEWAMAEVIRNAPVMQKAQDEIDRTIGKGKTIIEQSDISKLPYLQAIVKETFRLHPAAPLLLPHKVQEDIEICGFTVPKGSQVLVNAWAIGRHPDAWPDPDSFVPERFLGSEIDVKGQHFGLIPFAAGRRICPGLPLALQTIHYVLASLISSFIWVLEGSTELKSSKDMNMDDEYRITLRKAKPLRVIPISRIS